MLNYKMFCDFLAIYKSKILILRAFLGLLSDGFDFFIGLEVHFWTLKYRFKHGKAPVFEFNFINYSY